jgi:hypothetical protein
MKWNYSCYQSRGVKKLLKEYSTHHFLDTFIFFALQKIMCMTFFRKAARDRKLQTKLLAEATDDRTFSSIGRRWMLGLKYHFTKTGGTDQ